MKQQEGMVSDLGRLLVMMGACVVLFGSAGDAWAQDADEEKEETKESAASDKAEESEESSSSSETENAAALGQPVVNESRPWTLAMGVSTRIGQGTFVSIDPNPNDRQIHCPEALGEQDCEEGSNAFDRWSNFYSFSPSYTKGKFTATASWNWSHWLTAGGGLIEPNEIRISDLSFDLFWAGHTFGPLRTTVLTDFGFSVPTSRLSQASNMIVDTFGVVALRQPVMGKVFLTGSLTGGKTFHNSTSPAVSIAEVGEDNVLFRANGAEDLGGGLVAIGGRNTEYSLAGGFTATVLLSSKFFTSVRYRYTRFWSYEGFIPEEADPFTSENAFGGRGVGDLSAGSIGLTYRAHPMVFLRASLSTAQAPKTDDQGSFRFPFWNFEAPAANRSAVNFGASLVY